MSEVQLKKFGNRAFVIATDEPLSPATTLVLQDLEACLKASGFAIHMHFAYAELLVEVQDIGQLPAVSAFAKTCFTRLQSQRRNQPLSETKGPRLHEIPVQYNGEDLSEVARILGISEAEVIEQHTSVECHVYALGFQPGFAFMAPVFDEARAAGPSIWTIPRKDVPRARVVANSVAIAAGQTAIYPHASPGGWQLLGTAAVPVFDPSLEQLSIFKVGDRVRFKPVGSL